ncbi:MAG: SDR family NAD(P)-dependent oxidoreductase [Synechococcales bacterium]|nr:SDR family NAD(P)-dependent oxidoreductase [Synechococcales bacterium]
MSQQLAGKVALIVGGETVVGIDIAQEFARQGATLLVQGPYRGLASRIVQSIQEEGGEAAVYQGDLEQNERALDFVQTAVNRYGRIDSLVLATEIHASSQQCADLIPDARWTQQAIQSSLLTCYYALPYLQMTQGSILAICSEICPLMYSQIAPHEAALKAWLRSFIQSTAQQQTHRQVRANFIGSGPLDLTLSEETRDGLQSAMLGIDPIEVPQVCRFLASDRAADVTGAAYIIRDCLPEMEAIAPFHQSHVNCPIESSVSQVTSQ